MTTPSDDIVQRAKAFAQTRHDGHVRDDGRNYFDAHLEPIAHAVAALTPNDHELIAAAYVHDTLEDTATTLDELREHFGERVARIVHEVTKDADGTFPRLHSADAIALKLVDRAQNITDMEAWSDEKKKRYLQSTKFW